MNTTKLKIKKCECGHIFATKLDQPQCGNCGLRNRMQKCYACQSEIDDHCCEHHDDSYCESCCEMKREFDRENYYERMYDLD